MSETTGQRIKRLRNAKGWTQEQLAEKCGVASFKAVNRWERDFNLPSGNNLWQLSKALGVSVDELLGGD